jgi:hypothetical protein
VMRIVIIIIVMVPVMMDTYIQIRRPVGIPGIKVERYIRSGITVTVPGTVIVIPEGINVRVRDILNMRDMNNFLSRSVPERFHRNFPQVQ